MTDGNLPNWLQAGAEVAGILGGLMSFAAAWAMRTMKQGLVSKEEFEAFTTRHTKEHAKLDERLDDGDKQFVEIGADRRYAPRANDLAAIGRDISEVKIKVAALAATEAGTKDRLERIEEQLDQVILLQRGAK